MSKKPAAAKQAPQPVLSLTKTNDMNMLVLKRIDSQIEEILATAGQVCLYRMSVDDQQWQRKNIEGSLFLIKRRSQPRFQMLVLNKLSTDNYIETVHGGLEMETNPPYLMYTHGNDEIHGIWFYDENDLQRLSSLLHKILNQLPKPDAADPASKAQQKARQAPVPAEGSAAPSPAQPNAAPAGPAADAAVTDAAGGALRPAASVVSPAATNGTGGTNALHKLLSRAAKHTSSPGTPPVPAAPASTGAAAAVHAPVAGSGALAPSVTTAAAPRGPPQPPLGVLSPEVAREKVKAMLIRLANNEGFVDMLAQEMRTVGLLQ
eukprot:gene3775-4034_t